MRENIKEAELEGKYTKKKKQVFKDLLQVNRSLVVVK